MTIDILALFNIQMRCPEHYSLSKCEHNIHDLIHYIPNVSSISVARSQTISIQCVIVSVVSLINDILSVSLLVLSICHSDIVPPVLRRQRKSLHRPVILLPPRVMIPTKARARCAGSGQGQAFLSLIVLCRRAVRSLLP